MFKDTTYFAARSTSASPPGLQKSFQQFIWKDELKFSYFRKDIVITVVDEVNSKRKKFICQQHILLKTMGYFRYQIHILHQIYTPSFPFCCSEKPPSMMTWEELIFLSTAMWRYLPGWCNMSKRTKMCMWLLRFCVR